MIMLVQTSTGRVEDVQVTPWLDDGPQVVQAHTIGKGELVNVTCPKCRTTLGHSSLEWVDASRWKCTNPTCDYKFRMARLI